MSWQQGALTWLARVAALYDRLGREDPGLRQEAAQIRERLRQVTDSSR